MKKWLIASACLMAAGMIVFAVCFWAAGFDFANWGTQDMVTNTYITEESFSHIQINTMTANVILAPSEDGQVKVVCREDSKLPHSVAVEEDTLVISCKDNRKWYDHIGLNWEMTTVTVYLPAGEYGELLVKNSTGDVKVAKDLAFQKAEVSVTTGNVFWNGAVGSKLHITGTTGCIHVQDVVCDEMQIKSSTGDVKLSRVDALKIEIKTTTGSVTGTLLSDKIFTAKSTTGKVSVPPSAGEGECKVTVTTGNIQITIE